MISNRNRKISAIAWMFCIFCAMGRGQEVRNASEGPSRQVLELPTAMDIQRYAGLLDESPKGFGEPYTNREAWESIGDAETKKQIISQAELLLNKPFPVWNNAAYMVYFETGSREESQKMYAERAAWIPILTWAECLENKGRFIPAIEQAMQGYFDQPSWVLPPHDRGRKNIEGKGYFVDLAAASIAQTLAQSLYLLQDKLSPAIRGELMDQLQQRIFQPVLGSLKENEKTENWWLLTTNNWNAVCLAGVTGAALAALSDKKDRAIFVAIAARYSENSKVGFTDDGYCSEGLGYYNYGFGHYIVLREALWQATHGTLDLFADEKFRKIAAYPINIQLTEGLYPTIADCKANTKPSNEILWYNTRILGLPLAVDGSFRSKLTGRSLIEDVMYSFPNSATKAPATDKGVIHTGLPPVSYFDKAGILIFRAFSGGGNGLSVAIKGGNNNEHHNHNDLGSYTLSTPTQKIVEDPGGPAVYTAQTFSKDRYSIRCINSFGHPVPVPAQQLQIPGATANVRLLDVKTSGPEKQVRMNLRAAYPKASLKQLERSFLSANDRFIVTDEVSFESPQLFETALITRAPYRINNSRSIVFKTMEGDIEASIDAGGEGFQIVSETIQEEKPAFDRIAIRLSKPVQQGKVVVTFRKVAYR